MKRQVKYRVLMIPGKISMEVRLMIDTSKTRFNPSGESTTNINGDIYTNLTLFPFIAISILRSGDTDENGQRQRVPFNPNDNLSMTRHQFPIFVLELEKLNESMKIPELYSYVSKRLTLNEELAEHHRRVFVIGNMTVELSPVVLSQPDESQVEGIRLKFNNEQSTVALTLNDVESLLFTLRTLDIDSLVMMMHLNYFQNMEEINKGNTVPGFNPYASTVDIKPKSDD